MASSFLWVVAVAVIATTHRLTWFVVVVVVGVDVLVVLVVVLD